MSCQHCGRGDGHYIGCAVLRQAAQGLTPASQCAKDGCSNPRAVSKGPRPAKYCEEHKTGSK